MQGIIKFIPVKHGDGVATGDLGLFGISGQNKYLGFKPGRAGKREGWLIVLSTNVNPPRRLMPRRKSK